MKEIITTKNAPAAVGAYSQAVKSGNLLFCSGQIALDPASGNLVGNDIKTQTEQVMHNISAVLSASGATFEDVVKRPVFLPTSMTLPSLTLYMQNTSQANQPAVVLLYLLCQKAHWLKWRSLLLFKNSAYTTLHGFVIFILQSCAFYVLGKTGI